MTVKQKTAFIINLLTIPLEILAFYIRPDRYGIPAICFYTVLSNMLVPVSSVFYLISLKDNKFERLTGALRYTSAIMLTVTFLIVVLVLVWYTDPLVVLFEKNNFFHHILIPVATLISYLYFENKITEKKTICFPILFTLVYAIIMVYLNYKGIINGPYPFFMVQIIGMPKVILSCSGLLAGLYVLCRVMYWLGIKLSDSDRSANMK